MQPPATGEHVELQAFTSYLTILVRLQVDSRVQSKLDGSGVVQQTLLEAHQSWDRLEGLSKAAQAAWLRRTLSNNLADELRKCRVRLHDRERSLEDALEDSSVRLHSWLAADQSSPSDCAMQIEQTLRLTTALADLPEKQRRAVELRHLRGLSLTETADQLGCSKAAVVGLLHRGVRKLRTNLSKDSGGR